MKSVNIMMLGIGLMMLIGCDKPAKWHDDQELREQLFFKCLQALPAGPQSTKYNDWDEVVAECGHQSYYLAHRCVENCE